MKTLTIIIVGACVTFSSMLNHADAQRRGGGGMRGGGGARGGGGMSRSGGGMSRGGARTSVTSRPSRPSGGSVSRPSAPAQRPSAPMANRPSGAQTGARPGGAPSRDLGAGGANAGNRPSNRPAGDRGNIGNGDRANIGNGNTNRPINIQDNDIVAGGGNWDYNHGCCYGGWGAAAAGFVAGAAIGSMLYTLPPACPAYMYSGMTYNHCGGVWYAPQFEGTETTYIVVEAPPGAPPDTAQPPTPTPPK